MAPRRLLLCCLAGLAAGLRTPPPETPAAAGSFAESDRSIQRAASEASRPYASTSPDPKVVRNMLDNLAKVLRHHAEEEQATKAAAQAAAAATSTTPAVVAHHARHKHNATASTASDAATPSRRHAAGGVRGWWHSLTGKDNKTAAADSSESASPQRDHRRGRRHLHANKTAAVADGAREAVRKLLHGRQAEKQAADAEATTSAAPRHSRRHRLASASTTAEPAAEKSEEKPRHRLAVASTTAAPAAEKSAEEHRHRRHAVSTSAAPAAEKADQEPRKSHRFSWPFGRHKKAEEPEEASASKQKASTTRVLQSQAKEATTQEPSSHAHKLRSTSEPAVERASPASTAAPLERAAAKPATSQQPLLRSPSTSKLPLEKPDAAAPAASKLPATSQQPLLRAPETSKLALEHPESAVPAEHAAKLPSTSQQPLLRVSSTNSPAVAEQKASSSVPLERATTQPPPLMRVSSTNSPAAVEQKASSPAPLERATTQPPPLMRVSSTGKPALEHADAAAPAEHAAKLPATSLQPLMHAPSTSNAAAAERHAPAAATSAPKAAMPSTSSAAATLPPAAVAVSTSLRPVQHAPAAAEQPTAAPKAEEKPRKKLFDWWPFPFGRKKSQEEAASTTAAHAAESHASPSTVSPSVERVATTTQQQQRAAASLPSTTMQRASSTSSPAVARLLPTAAPVEPAAAHPATSQQPLLRVSSTSSVAAQHHPQPTTPLARAAATLPSTSLRPVQRVPSTTRQEQFAPHAARVHSTSLHPVQHAASGKPEKQHTPTLFPAGFVPPDTPEPVKQRRGKHGYLYTPFLGNMSFSADVTNDTEVAMLQYQSEFSYSHPGLKFPLAFSRVAGTCNALIRPFADFDTMQGHGNPRCRYEPSISELKLWERHPVDLAIVIPHDSIQNVPRDPTQLESWSMHGAWAWRRYAEHHGYAFYAGKIFGPEKRCLMELMDPKFNRSREWWKPCAAMQLVSKHKYLMIVDADTFVTKPRLRLEPLLRLTGLMNSTSGKQFAVAAEWGSCARGHRKYSAGTVNTGIVFVKDTAKDLLHEWFYGKTLRGGMLDQFQKAENTWSYDQRGFALTVMAYHRENVTVLPAGCPINSPWGDFISHLVSGSFDRDYYNPDLRSNLVMKARECVSDTLGRLPVLGVMPLPEHLRQRCSLCNMLPQREGNISGFETSCPPEKPMPLQQQ